MITCPSPKDSHSCLINVQLGLEISIPLIVVGVSPHLPWPPQPPHPLPPFQLWYSPMQIQVFSSFSCMHVNTSSIVKCSSIFVCMASNMAASLLAIGTFVPLCPFLMAVHSRHQCHVLYVCSWPHKGMFSSPSELYICNIGFSLMFACLGCKDPCIHTTSSMFWCRGVSPAVISLLCQVVKHL